ncbi:MAG: hypothetical protein H0T79_07215, partial [Deltaproteobacteria bacterium]|nr:hypothetical protein [Deltaproteobacteria bacterium]
MKFFSIDRVMPSATRADKVRGVHVAIVIDNKDGGPDNPGYRLLVRIPAFSEQEKTFWARVAVPMAGNGRGTYFLPEVDDQVLVVFEHGFIGKPIVIGALWSKSQTPVELNKTGNNNTKLIKSRTGHRIIFDDADGAEMITIVDSTKKNKIVLDTKKNLFTIECAGDVEVKAKGDAVFHADTVKIGTSAEVTAKGAQALAHAGSNFTVKAGSLIEVSGTAITANVQKSAA